MNKYLSRAISSIVASMMVFSLAACGTSTKTEEKAQETPAAAETKVEEKKSAQPATVKV